MALTHDYPPGATPLNPDELEGLIPTHITTQGQLNEWEQRNIVEGEQWAFSRKRGDLLSTDFACALHKHMFGDTWRWAGMIRDSEKNLGIDPAQIRPALHDLFEDVKAQLEHRSYPLIEVAGRFHHRLVSIHPFPNGNGRFSRTMADLLLVQHGGERLTWGHGDLVAEGQVRDRYLEALRAADTNDYQRLLEFVRS